MAAFSVSPPTALVTAGEHGKADPIFDTQRLVRFLARDGRTYYGDAILPRGVTDIAQARQARIVQGDIFGRHNVTDRVADIRLLLAPLAPEDVRTVRCLGLNYAAHAREVGVFSARATLRD